MNPKILILKDNDRIKKVLQLTNIKNFDRSITNKYMIYDLIIDDNFNQELYANNLNYDGFYIFLNRGTNNLNNYEFLSYHNYYIIKKSEFIPYYLLEDNKNDPIIFRNFKNNFNIAPYIKPYEIINHPEIIEENQSCISIFLFSYFFNYNIFGYNIGIFFCAFH